MSNNYKKILKSLNKFRKVINRTITPKWVYFLNSSDRPISSKYGLERGEPIDRFYIENFLKDNQVYIKGDCLEVLDNQYTSKYGGKNVSKSDILDIETSNKKSNIVGDLRNLKTTIHDNSYDCIILTQVLQFIDDYNSVLFECKRILKPGGHLLITIPSMSRIDCVAGVAGDFWRFTEASLNYILKDKFDDFKVSSFGNVKTGVGFWVGLSQQDIKRNSFDFNDKNFPILIAAVAKK